MKEEKRLRSTTIVAVRKAKGIAMAGDGQVSMGHEIMKSQARKVRTLYKGSVLSGFAGAVADALTLFERIEKKLEQYQGDLLRASIELTREWRSDKYLRRLEAMLLLADKKHLLLLAGTGEVIECEEAVAAIGSGGNFARAAALAMVEETKLPAKDIAFKALTIASRICVYTNDTITLEELK